jgi:hypothetical protein
VTSPSGEGSAAEARKVARGEARQAKAEQAEVRAAARRG